MSGTSKVFAVSTLAAVAGVVLLWTLVIQPLLAMIRVTADDPFHYTRVTVSTQVPPARFSAPLPTVDQAEKWDERFPPVSYVRHQLCTGDRAMLGRLTTAVVASVAAGATQEELAEAYQELLGGCVNPGPLCALAEQGVTSKEPAALTGLLWLGLADCTDDRYAPLFNRPNVPSLASIRWLLARGWNHHAKTPWSPTLDRAVREVVQLYPDEARAAAMLLGENDDPRAAKTLLALHASTRDPFSRRQLAFALYRQSLPQARSLFRSACAEVEDPVCQGSNDAPKSQHPAPIAERVLDEDQDLSELLADGEIPASELLAALAACVEKGLEERRDPCLQALAERDRPRAAALVINRKGKDHFGELNESLRRWPTHQALVEEMTSRGLVGSATVKDGATPRELLEQGGRAHTFDVETDQFPNEHDSLLRNLAALAPQDFEGVLFEELAPSKEGKPYLLHAYVDGQRYSVRAENLGDWFDLDAVLGLLNHLAQVRKKPTRFLVLEGFDQTATVVAGPEDGLRKALADKVLVAARSTSQAMELGKDFEQRAYKEATGQPGSERTND